MREPLSLGKMPAVSTSMMHSRHSRWYSSSQPISRACAKSECSIRVLTMSPVFPAGAREASRKAGQDTSYVVISRYRLVQETMQALSRV